MQSAVTGYYFYIDPPQAVDDCTETTYLDEVLIDVLDNDSSEEGELDPSSVTIVTEPLFGTASVDPVTGEISYEPDGDYSGADDFEYTVEDTMGQVSNVASVDIDVTNDPPVAEDDSAETNYLDDVLIDVLENDSSEEDDIDPSSVTIVIPPQFGTVDVDPVTGDISYEPDGDYSGEDNFKYTVADMLGDVSNIASVEVEVNNEPPEIDDFSADRGEAFVWTFSGTVDDEFPDGATVSLTGSLTASDIPVNADGSFSYKAYFGEAHGFVEAVATDELGEESEAVLAFMDNE